MSKLTKSEKAWIEKLQAVLNECPSQRLGFYTIGDANVSIYDRNKEDKIYQLTDNEIVKDFGPAVDKCNAYLGEIIFPFSVHSTAG